MSLLKVCCHIFLWVTVLFSLNGCFLTRDLWRADNPNGKKSVTLHGELIALDGEGAMFRMQVSETQSVYLVADDESVSELREGDSLHVTFAKPGDNLRGWRVVLPMFLNHGALIPVNTHQLGAIRFELEMSGTDSSLRVIPNENITIDSFLSKIDSELLPPASREIGAWDQVVWERYSNWKNVLNYVHEWLPSPQPGNSSTRKQFRCVGGMLEDGTFQADLRNIEEILEEIDCCSSDGEQIAKWIDMLSTSYVVLAELDANSKPVAFGKVRCDTIFALRKVSGHHAGPCALSEVTIIPANNIPPVDRLPSAYDRKVAARFQVPAAEYTTGRLIGRIALTPLAVVGDGVIIACAVGSAPIWGPIVLLGMSNQH